MTSTDTPGRTGAAISGIVAPLVALAPLVLNAIEISSVNPPEL